MKKLYGATALLFAIFIATLWNAHYVADITAQLSHQLSQATESAKADDWEQAEALTQQAEKSWQDHTHYLYTVLRHTDTDAVNAAFQEVLEFLSCRELGEYCAANASLITKIELLADMEVLNWKNVL